MKFYQKFLNIFLIGGFFTLQGMEEKPSINEQSNANPEVEIFSPFSLKTQTAIYLSNLIRSGKLDWEIVKTLPEGLERFVELFYMVDIYITSKGDYQSKHNQNSKFRIVANLIYKLIDSGSEHIETFFAALDDFFDSYYSDGIKINKLRNCGVCEDKPDDGSLDLMCLFLKIILNPEDTSNIIDQEQSNYLNEEELEDKVELMKFFAENAIHFNLINFVNLLLNLKVVPRDIMLTLFWTSSRVEMLELLHEKLKITKNEFEGMLNEDFNVYSKPKIVKYFVKLIEFHELDTKNIINTEFSKPLLHQAISALSFKSVNYLLDQGANPHIKDTFFNTDALSKALSIRKSIVNNINNEKGMTDQEHAKLKKRELKIKLIIEALNNYITIYH